MRSASSLFSTLAGKVCLVTGGGSGIGAAIACGLVGNGAKVYIASRKDTSAFASSLTNAAKASGGQGQCISLRADIGTDEGVIALSEELASARTVFIYL